MSDDAIPNCLSTGHRIHGVLYFCVAGSQWGVGLCTRTVACLRCIGANRANRVRPHGADAGVPTIVGSRPVSRARRNSPCACAWDRTANRLPLLPPWSFMLLRLCVFPSVCLYGIRFCLASCLCPPPCGCNAARASVAAPGNLRPPRRARPGGWGWGVGGGACPRILRRGSRCARGPSVKSSSAGGGGLQGNRRHQIAQASAGIGPQRSHARACVAQRPLRAPQ